MSWFNRKDLLAYLDRCRMPDGGYCSFHDPSSGAGFSNVADTCWSLSAWSLLGGEIPELSKTRSFILHELSTDGLHRQSPYLSWALESKLLAGLSLSEEEGRLLRKETFRLLMDEGSWIERSDLVGEITRLMKVRLLSGLLPGQDEIGPLSGLIRESPEVPTILELCDLAFLSGLLPEESQVPTGERLYRHPSLGYVLVPGSSRSDLFILLAGLRLREEPLDSGEILRFRIRVLFCQGLGGGFGPVGGARPTLEATRTALEILALLSDGSRKQNSGTRIVGNGKKA